MGFEDEDEMTRGEQIATEKVEAVADVMRRAIKPAFALRETAGFSLTVDDAQGEQVVTYRPLLEEMTMTLVMEFGELYEQPNAVLEALGRKTEAEIIDDWEALGFERRKPGELMVYWNDASEKPRLRYLIHLRHEHVTSPRRAVEVVEGLAKLERLIWLDEREAKAVD